MRNKSAEELDAFWCRHQEKRREYNRRYRLRHPEAQARYRAKNRRYFAETARDYRERNKDALKVARVYGVGVAEARRIMGV